MRDRGISRPSSLALCKIHVSYCFFHVYLSISLLSVGRGKGERITPDLDRSTHHHRWVPIHSKVFFFLPHKGISTPTHKAPHTFFSTSSSTDYFFSFRVAFRDPKSIPEDASASRWINDRSAQARAGVTRARRGRESAEEERAGEALGRRASRSIVPAYRARAGRRVSPEGRGGTKTRVVLLQQTTTSAHPTDPTDPRDKKRESSCRPAGFTSCRAWGSSGRPRRPSTRARR